MLNKTQIEGYVIGLLAFIIAVLLIPYIQNFVIGFVSIKYVTQLITYAVAYTLYILVIPKILLKIYNR